MAGRLYHRVGYPSFAGVSRKEQRYLRRQRKQNPIHDISIISQNCIGAILYHRQSARFLSPTINCAIRGDNFVKLCLDLQKFLAIDAKPAGSSFLITDDGTRIDYPLLSLGDEIVIDAIHYDSGETAAAKWNDRRKRVDFSKMFIVANTWDLNNDEALISRLLNIHIPKIIFSDLPQYASHPDFVYLDEERFVRNARGVPQPPLMAQSKNGYQIVAEEVCDIYQIISKRVVLFNDQNESRSKKLF